MTMLQMRTGMMLYRLTKMLACKWWVREEKHLQGVQEKLCFSTIHCNPSLAYIALRDLQSSQRNGVYSYSLLLAGSFCATNSSRLLERERCQTFENYRKKNTKINKHPVHNDCETIWNEYRKTTYQLSPIQRESKKRNTLMMIVLPRTQSSRLRLLNL